MRLLALFLGLMLLISSCNFTKKEEKNILEKPVEKNKKIETVKEIIKYSHKDSIVLSSINDSIANIILDKNLKIVYTHPYSKLEYTKEYDRVSYHVNHTAKVDTTDFVVNIVKTENSEYAVAGYNHIYDFSISSKIDSTHYEIHIDKKRDLSYLLEHSDVWIESNLNAWSLITIKPEYGISIFQLDINPRYNYGDIFYFVFDTLGKTINQGYHCGWGGDGPDGKIYVNENYMVTCNEVYNFVNNSINVFTKSPTNSCSNLSNLSKEEKNEYFGRILHTHAMRMLNDSAFLVIYNRPGEVLEYNGTIYSLNLEILQKFKYYGFWGEMDAILLSNDNYSPDTMLLFDRERKVLLFVEKFPPYKVTEIGIDKMKKSEEEEKFINMKLLFKNDFPSFEFRQDSDGIINYKITDY